VADEEEFLDDDDQSVSPDPGSDEDQSQQDPGSEESSPEAIQIPPLETSGEQGTPLVDQSRYVSPGEDPNTIDDSLVNPISDAFARMTASPESPPAIPSITPDDTASSIQEKPSLSVEPPEASGTIPPEIPETKEAPQIPSLSQSGSELPEQPVPSLPDRKQDAADLGPMSFYKRKNIEKGRGDKIPGLELGEDGKFRQIGMLDSGSERDAEGLNKQREVGIDSLKMPSGPLAADLMPDVIPEMGSSGPSSFKPQGQDSNAMQGSVESAADAVDTVATGIIDVLNRLTINMKKANDNLRQIMDKLEVEDHQDEF